MAKEQPWKDYGMNKADWLAAEVAKAGNAGHQWDCETVDFNDPNRPLTCLEVDFPIIPINQIAAIEGNAGKPIYQMSKWWARRRSSVFRSMLLAAAMKAPDDSAEASDNNSDIDAWDNALSVPFSQLESYVQYISDKSPFGTHQGIKGLQFPRVMVVLDDNEARGFMFSYDKLLGAKAPTSTDQKNVQEGRETSIDRTRRLFYVTCSRAQSSLAVVVYTNEKDQIRDHLQTLNWFDDGEIIDI